MQLGGTIGIYEKLLDLQGQMPKLQKDSLNPHYKNSYVSLEAVLALVLPELNKRGILLLQLPDNVGGAPALTTKLIDTKDSMEVESTMMLVLEKDNPQGQGSALTYAKRYSILSILGLTADEDDDGEKASSSRKDEPSGSARPAAF